MDEWPADGPGVVTLPSGRRVRGRGVRQPPPAGPVPEFGLYLLTDRPEVGWAARLVVWPDFRLPRDRDDAHAAFVDALERSGRQRVELACAGGTGRTGTALACLAVLDGVAPAEAVAWVRARYRPKAVETPWQRRYVERFSPAPA